MEISSFSTNFFSNNYVTLEHSEAIQKTWNNILNGLLRTSQWQHSKREFNDIADFAVW
jgi:hypothetical protein